MASTNVNFIAMADAAKQVQAATQTINGLENRVDSHLTNLIGGWKGAASTQFAGVLQDWLLQFRDIRTQLEIMAEKLGATHNQYQSTEQDEQQAINSLRGLLNRTL